MGMFWGIILSGPLMCGDLCWEFWIRRTYSRTYSRNTFHVKHYQEQRSGKSGENRHLKVVECVTINECHWYWEPPCQEGNSMPLR